MLAGITRLDPGLAPGAGLDLWPEIAAEGLLAGRPVQHGAFALDDKATGLSAGTWHCTPMTGRPGPYPVDEFMVVLGGSVTIAETSGRETTVRAGQSFFLPKGLDCSWRQEEPVLKFFVILERGDTPAATGTPKSLICDPATPLAPSPGPDPALVASGNPVWHDRVLQTGAHGAWSVGLWSTTPYERRAVPFPRWEMMHFLEGEVTLFDGAGNEETFGPGDTIFVAKGAPMGWRNAVTVKKIYCSYAP